MAKYIFEQPALTCNELEKQAKLAKGQIKSLTIYPSGAVEMEMDDAVTSMKLQELKAVLRLYNLPRGKKPEVEKE